MRKQYDFSQARKFFRESSESSGIPYQTLINLYLRDCAQQGRKLSIEWRASAQGV